MQKTKRYLAVCRYEYVVSVRIVSTITQGLDFSNRPVRFYFKPRDLDRTIMTGAFI